MISYPAFSPLSGDRHRPERAIGMTGLGDRHHPERAIDITGIRIYSSKSVSQALTRYSIFFKIVFYADAISYPVIHFSFG
jgi:hypothetical protein